MSAEKIGQAISLRPVPAWDARCRQAHAEGRAVVFHPTDEWGSWTWGMMPTPPPGDDLPTWPEVQP